MRADPVLAAGIGVRRGRGWAVRAASFRIGEPEHGNASLGIQIAHPADAAAIVDLLAGLARPAYGELRVLGHDMATVRGRAAVRQRVGVARRTTRPLSAMRIRRLVEHAARLAGQRRYDRRALAASILDRLSLMPWAEVPLRAAPDAVARRARLAAAAVHQPDLILLDSLLDGLQPRDMTALAEAVRDLSRDSAILVAGCDSLALELACDEVIVLADGILVNA
ncbi:MAG TPA: ATP-binding cassette domain-containing protein [Streptosporangiaceae bacterium]|nr:ATP-binding cassette domain-containing protein [Streptosporangiaceae bacterium]